MAAERKDSTISVRRASQEDAHGIARVHVRSWREAYAHVFSPYLLEGLSVRARTERWTRTLSEGAEVWVAEANGEIVGWASAGRQREVDAPASRELTGIYVLRDYYGSGAGQLLLDAALGDEAAYLWVLADNPRALAFYRRNGFAHDGVTKVDTFGGEPAHELRMVRGA